MTKKEELQQLLQRAMSPGGRGSKRRALNRMHNFFAEARVQDRAYYVQALENACLQFARNRQFGILRTEAIAACASAARAVLGWEDVELLKSFLAVRMTHDEDRQIAMAIMSGGLWNCLAESRTLSLEFCRQVLRFQTVRLEQYLRQHGGATRVQIDRLEDIPIQQFLVHTLFAKGDEFEHSMKRRQWFIHVVRAYADGDADAADYLDSLYQVLEFMVDQERTPLAFVPASEYSPQRVNRDPQLMGRVCFTIPDTIWGHWNGFVTKRQSKRARLREKAWAFNKWVAANEDAILERSLYLADRILNDASCDIRPFGHDRISIRVSTLRLLGINQIALYPEAEEHPNTKLILTLHKTGGFRLKLWGSLRDFNLVCSEYVYSNVDNCDPELSKVILEYVLLHAIYRIVVKDEARQDEEGNDVTRTKRERSVANKRRTVVRSFIRRLPHGQQASEQARLRAYAALGVDLPEGVTFVKSHDRSIDMPDAKGAPLFSYSDDTIKQSIEED